MAECVDDTCVVWGRVSSGKMVLRATCLFFEEPVHRIEQVEVVGIFLQRTLHQPKKKQHSVKATNFTRSVRG